MGGRRRLRPAGYTAPPSDSDDELVASASSGIDSSSDPSDDDDAVSQEDASLDSEGEVAASTRLGNESSSDIDDEVPESGGFAISLKAEIPYGKSSGEKRSSGIAAFGVGDVPADDHESEERKSDVEGSGDRRGGVLRGTRDARKSNGEVTARTALAGRQPTRGVADVARGRRPR